MPGPQPPAVPPGPPGLIGGGVSLGRYGPLGPGVAAILAMTRGLSEAGCDVVVVGAVEAELVVMEVDEVAPGLVSPMFSLERY